MQMEELNYFDIVIATIVLFVAARGFLHGFIKEFIGLVGLIGGVYLASRYGLETGLYLSEHVYPLESKSLIFIIGFMVFLVSFWLSSLIISAFVLAVTKKEGMGFVNRLLGFIAGGAKIFCVLAIFVYLFNRVDVVKQNVSSIVENSQTYPLLVKAGSVIVGIDMHAIQQTDTSVQSVEVNTTAPVVSSVEQNTRVESNTTQETSTHE